MASNVNKCMTMSELNLASKSLILNRCIDETCSLLFDCFTRQNRVVNMSNILVTTEQRTTRYVYLLWVIFRNASVCVDNIPPSWCILRQAGKRTTMVSCWVKYEKKSGMFESHFWNWFHPYILYDSEFLLSHNMRDVKYLHVYARVQTKRVNH